jgi:hypothetical protein
MESRRPLLFLAAVWLAIPLIDAVGSVCIPRSAFAFRPWELVRESGRFESGFAYDAAAFGDLSHMAHTSRFRTEWHEVFHTDSKGRRITSTPPADGAWPVVAVGDSQLVGAGVSDHETVPAHLDQGLGVPVLNYGGHEIWEYLGDEQFARRPPRLVIWMAIDRDLTTYALERARRKHTADPDPSPTGFDRGALEALGVHLKEKPTLSRWASRKMFGELRWWSCRSLGPNIAWVEPTTGMLFYKREVDAFLRPEAEWDVDGIVEEVALVRTAVRERGGELLFVVAPTKTAVYAEQLPAELSEHAPSRPFPSAVAAGLEAAGLPHVDLYPPFRTAAADELLVHLDDTHWNPAGHRVAAEAIAAYLRTRPDLLGR